MRKLSAAVGSATIDATKSMAAALPVPKPTLASKPPPGLNGPKGLSPRATYSRVNTGAPSMPDAGGAAQKGLPPQGLNFLPAKTASREDTMTTMAQRPNLQELLKSAMAGTIEKSQINDEAARQRQTHTGEEKVAAVQSPDHYSTEYVQKLAGAVGYIAEQVKLADDGNVQQPGQGPGALKTLESNRTEDGPEAGQMGGSIKKNAPPQQPTTQKEEVQVGKASTGMETNDGNMHGEQPVEPISNEDAPIAPANPLPAPTLQTKQSSIEYGNMARLGLVPERSDAVSAVRAKLAEDALSPSKIEAGKQNPPDSSASEEAVPAQPSDVTSQAQMVASNDAAINYKKREAKENPKRDVNQVLEQPALTRRHDPVLHKTLDNANKAGVKLSHDATKLAAARALLLNLQEKVAEEKCPKCEKAECVCPSAKDGEGKKEKASQLGANAVTPTVSTPAFSG